MSSMQKDAPCSRMLSGRWVNKKPFTRRVSWYCTGWDRTAEPEWSRNKDIRLKFEDEEGVAHKFYQDNEEAAKRDYNDFRNGVLTTPMIRRGE